MDGYRKHAERFGVEQVFEAAVNDPAVVADPRSCARRSTRCSPSRPGAYGYVAKLRDEMQS